MARPSSLLLIGFLGAIPSLMRGEDAPPPVDPVRGQIIIFTRPGETPMWKAFEQESLPALGKLAGELEVDFRVIDTTVQGAPEEVHLTPLIVFQNHKGRSIFQGRYTDLKNVEHFVRTARFVPRPEKPLERGPLPVMRMGRAAVGSPIKITPLDGEPPLGYDEERFRADAMRAIPLGFSHYRMQETQTFGRSDRLFYMDFYPVVIENGELVISLALFSQFNCHTPVYTAYEDEIRGPWLQKERLWAQAAALLEKEVLRQVENSTIGDGFLPLAPNSRAVSWDQLGLALPPPPNPAARTIPAGVTLPSRWEIVPEPIDETPLVTFRFAPPLDSYTGTATEISGSLTLAEGNLLEGASGFVEVPVTAVSMGMDELDEGIHGDLLKDQFPRARFELKSVTPAVPGPLDFSAARMFDASGDFTMMGVTIPVTVRAEVDPVVDGETGKAQLLVAASFDLSIADPYNLEGPPGPAPENQTLEFFLRFAMRGVE